MNKKFFLCILAAGSLFSTCINFFPQTHLLAKIKPSETGFNDNYASNNAIKAILATPKKTKKPTSTKAPIPTVSTTPSKSTSPTASITPTNSTSPTTTITPTKSPSPTTTITPTKAPSPTTTPYPVITNSPSFKNTSNFQIGYQYINDSNEVVANNSIVCSSVAEISSAFSKSVAGDTIYIKGGTYKNAILHLNTSGSSNKYINIKNYPGEKPVFINTVFEIYPNCKYINIDGLTFSDFDSSSGYDYCMKVYSGCSYINLENLIFTNITCKNPTSSSVYPLVIYGDSNVPITKLSVNNCKIYNCSTGWSEALAIIGNAENCSITNCTINNTGNIGIDICGNSPYTGTQGNSNNQPRNIKVCNNLVQNCNSPNATSAGIYCDGSRQVTISHNKIYNSQCGIELGAELPGADVHDFYVYNNLVVNCGRSITSGGYQKASAKHYNTYIYNNTIICKDANAFASNHALVTSRTSNFNFFNNIIYAFSSNTKFYYQEFAIQNCNITNNCWYIKDSTATIPKYDTKGFNLNPNFKNVTSTLNGDFSLNANSPYINKGIALNQTLIFDKDLAGNKRINNVIDLGAYEFN